MTIASSDAFRDDDRVLPQHQAAATLLQARLAVPGTETVRWLDLACGRGQLVHTLEEAVTPESRAKLLYVAYDADQFFAREAVKTAEALGFGSVDLRVGEVTDVSALVGNEPRFDFVTLTNALHEVPPAQLGPVLVAAVNRLSESGAVFVYDVETVHPPELGAVPWTGREMGRIVWRCLTALGVENYRPEVSRWRHRSTVAWSVHLERQHFAVSPEHLAERSATAVASVTQEVGMLLLTKLEGCREALEGLTRFGAETGEEQSTKESLLFDFWALTRALDAMPPEAGS